MNHPKINAILSDYNDCLNLLSFFINRNNHQNCENIIRYLQILGDDLDRLIFDSIHRPGSQQTDSEAHKAIDLDAAKRVAAVGI